jgi:sugar lactone lactonase YvrE
MINAQGVIRTVRNSLDNPAGLVFDAQDRLVYSEAGRNRIVRLDLSANSTTVIAGTGDAGFSGDGGLATAAKLNWPGDLAFDSQGNLLIADRGNRRVRRITSDGKIQTIIGSGLPFSYGDISGQQALDTGFGSLDGLAVDANDNVYLSESLRVDMISPDGAIRVVTGFVSEDDSGNLSYIDGPLNGADGLAVDGQGRIYISARQDGRVLVATPAGQ